MGLETPEHTKKTYLSIVAGKFAQKVEKGSEGATERYSEKKKGMLYEKYHGALSGVIKGFEIKTTEFGSINLDISVVDVMDTFNLSIPVDSKYFDSFCVKIKNADLNAEIKLVPYNFEKDGKKRSGMNLFQGDKLDQKIEYYFTKENQYDKPQMVSDMGTDGKLSDDDYKIFKMTERKYYKNMILQLNESLGVKAPDPTGGDMPGTEDLPFK